jgi:hypothetical protein
MELPWLTTTEFFCPVARRYVTVGFLTYDGRRPIGIASCSAFAEPSDLACGTPCLEKAREGAWPAAAARVC